MKTKWRINWDILFTIGVLATIYAFLLCVIYFAWIGAEYTFDGMVYFGKVDGWMCCLITYSIVRNIYKFDRKFQKGKGCK
jgi:hypothetical protein